MKDQTIFRVVNPNKTYTKISNVLLDDAVISFACKGFLVSILRLPVDWAFNIAWLRKTYGTSKRQAYALVNEALKNGYCQRARNRCKHGAYSGAIEYLFSDDPQELAALASQLSQPLPQNGEVLKNTTSPNPGNGHPYKSSSQSSSQSHNKGASTASAQVTEPSEFAGVDGLIPFDHVTDPAQIIEAGRIEAAKKDLGIDADRLPFTADCLRKIQRMHVDVAALVKRYLEKTKGKKPRNPDGYLMTMAKEAVAKRNGVSVAAVAQISKKRPAVIVNDDPIEPITGPIQITDALRATLSRFK